MSTSSGHSIELIQGNRSVRKLMETVLAEAGFEQVEDSESEPLADLLIVDVDTADSNAQTRRETYREADRPRLICGIGDPRGRAGEAHWLGRPFDDGELVAACRRTLGVQEDGSRGPEESDSEPSVRPATREVNYGTPEMEAEIDGELADLEAGPDGETDGGEESEVVEIDDASSMVVDVRDLGGPIAGGGRFEGEVRERELDVERLSERAEQLEPIAPFEDSKTNPTMPEVPTGREESGEGLEGNSSPPSAASTGAHRKPSPESQPVEANSILGADSTGPAAGEGARGEGGGVQGRTGSAPAVPSGFRADLQDLARRLANSWNRIGLTARWEDRAERLQRTFEALVEGGVRGASRELDRVPPAHGFSGTLELFAPFELIEVVQSRGFLGRLEISNEAGGYVLYVDGPWLVGVDDLEGRSDAMLLDCLREIEAFDTGVYRRLSRTLEESLTTPLEMRLRTDEETVSEEALEEARRMRAKWVVKEVMQTEQGSFAFIAGGDESGQPWPVDELGVRFDSLALGLIRDGSCQPRLADVGPETTVVAVPSNSIGRDESDQTPLEVELQELTRAPCTVRRLTDAVEAPEPEVRQAVQRLEAVGLVQKVAAAGGSDPDQTAEVETVDPADGPGSDAS